MVLFIVLYKVIHTFESVNEILPCDMYVHQVVQKKARLRPD